jgi:hypothetical protein
MLRAALYLALVAIGFNLDDAKFVSKNVSNDYCQMAAAVLVETVKPFDLQADSLDIACVRSYASYAGKIYVDAQIENGQDLVGPFSCTVAPYIIRFNVKKRSPSHGVVRLGIYSETKANSRNFDVTVVKSSWRSQCAGCADLSPCWSSFGIVTKSAKGWAAKIVPEPCGSDELGCEKSKAK